ncbi:hypothetical protein C5U62_32035 [Pseudomonas protegens]|uniref:AntA/AntB antirepressor domain-containing protein n=1 Tax=Pseudomonas protegens TaxID=380021 RepID=A0A2T6GBD1_9PSED|nr:antA/AntB antirepressor family protein [Pseudomonas protegens]PUA41464.1 hypothetical protein C5U62_32035 [Pseudomonas protegens]
MNTNQLIPVFTGTISCEQAQLVDARELHRFLEVDTHFKDWIARRIAEYGFTENEDYVLVAQNRAINGRGGDRRSKDYHVTLDMGKELAMVERNEKGRQARRYFIDMERKALEAAGQPALDLPPLALQRWLISFDHTGKQSITPVPIDAYVLTQQQMFDAFNTPNGIYLSLPELIDFAMATLTQIKIRTTQRPR